MTPAEQAAGPWTTVARLVRPQGRRGELLAELLTDFPERFAERKHLFLLRVETDTTPVREVELTSHWPHKGRVVLKFLGIDSISDADALRGLLVAIPAGERAVLADGAVYIGDLLGCEIVDQNAADAEVGVVTGFDRGSDLLSVRTPDGGEALVPFAGSYLVTMDFEARRITMRLPAGLLDINAPLTDEERREGNEPDLDASGE